MEKFFEWIINNGINSIVGTELTFLGQESHEPYSDRALYLLPVTGGSFWSPLYNFKTTLDTATKITQNNVLIICNI